MTRYYLIRFHGMLRWNVLEDAMLGLERRVECVKQRNLLCFVVNQIMYSLSPVLSLNSVSESCLLCHHTIFEGKETFNLLCNV